MAYRTKTGIRVAVLTAGLSLIASANPRNRETGARLPMPRLAGINSTVCVVLDDGTGRCWGDNSHGQTGGGGDAPFADKSLPVQVINLHQAVSISVGQNHACAVLADPGASVYCWGDKSFGQLGTGAQNGAQSPTAVFSGVTNAIAVAAGGLHTCALLVGGTVTCWGSNTAGQIQNAPIGGVVTTPTTQTLSRPAIAITAGYQHTCALLVDSTVFCWGSNVRSQLGLGTLSANGSGHVPGVTGAVQISAGSYTTCALLANGTVECWGDGTTGQFGNGTSSDHSEAVAVTGLTDAVEIQTGYGGAHTCAVRAGGTVQCWGANNFGALGDGTTTTRYTPVTVVGLSNIVEVVALQWTTCALDVTGVVHCWGYNGDGQLGNGTTLNSPVPGTVNGIAGSIGARGIAVGGNFVCARRGNGAVSCWGKNADGELGDGLTTDSPNPVQIANISDAVAVTAGASHACLLHASGAVSCWGADLNGELGNGGNSSAFDAPVAVVGVSNAVGIAAGTGFTCALIVDGTVRCWGENGVGELGTSGFAGSPIPISIAGLHNVVAISAGANHACAVLAGGSMQCWGSNSFWQLGNGGSGPSSVGPVPVVGMNQAISVTAGVNETCAVLADGGVDCWGENQFGEVGDSTTQDRSVPTPVIGISDAVGVSVGTYNACALHVEGNVSCWGNGIDSQLGTADDVNAVTYNVPASVIGSFTTVKGIQIPIPMSFAIAVAGGEGLENCVIQVGGQPRCWGTNANGDIGDGGGETSQARPAIVNSFTANVEPNATICFGGRLANVTALVNCPSGGWVYVNLTLQQGSISGFAFALTTCKGGLDEIPMEVVPLSFNGFQAGASTAKVEAVVVEKGQVTEDQHWTRAVTLSVKH